MNMVKEFYELDVWQLAKTIVVKVYNLTKQFPGQETYCLVDQLRRAANSVCANIAEGFERFHTKDKVRFYYHARASVSECKSHLLVAKDLGYIENEITYQLIAELTSVGVKINNMVSSLCRCAAKRNKKSQSAPISPYKSQQGP